MVWSCGHEKMTFTDGPDYTLAESMKLPVGISVYVLNITISRCVDVVEWSHYANSSFKYWL